MRLALYAAALTTATTLVSQALAQPATTRPVASVALSDLDIAQARQAYGKPMKDRSVDGHPLMIAGTRFARGLGTHADATLAIDVRGATRFTASVGVDDDADNASGDGHASVEFIVSGDDKVLYRSRVMRRGDAARAVDVPLDGIKTLTLRVDPTDDGINFDHADWADATFAFAGAAPVAVAAATSAPAAAPAVVLTPAPGLAPRINGARTFGARPGSPVLITVPCTGERPVKFAVDGLPPGLALDADRGLITGAIERDGDYALVVHASNARGEAKREWKIVVGEGTLAQTPPMGWNSWNVWGMAVDDAKVRAAADAFVTSGLIDHGWTYINIDDGWAVRPGGRDASLTGKPRDDDGRVLPNKKFPDMKALADYVHGKGLKIGIYSSPGPRTCGDVEGSYGYEAQDAAQYAAWGFDYLKYDWCSYGQYYTLKQRREKTQMDVHKENVAPYEQMRVELRKQSRDIVYSLCQYGNDKVWEWGASVDAQTWRTTGDINDSWRSMSEIGFGQAGHEAFAGPGHWNDPDMLVVGHLGWGPNVRATKLTPDEQYTHLSLWALLSAPLLIGCDLTRLDPFTLGLLTNDEVIDVSQDPLGKQAAKISDDGDHEVWAKPLSDGSLAVGLFNRGGAPAQMSVSFADLKLAADGAHDVRDLWRQQSLGAIKDAFTSEVAPHGVRLIRIAR